MLGVSKGTSAKEIKAAYRRLARKYHPDVNQGDAKAEARFKEVGEAYEVLSDPKKRSRYDELGANWKAYERAPQGAGWPGGGARVNVGGFGGGDVGGFSDFFRTFFGGDIGGAGFPGMGDDPFAASARAPNLDVEHAIELSLEDVLRGATRTLRIGGSGRQVEVKIPVGVGEGARIRVTGEGGQQGGRRGDLYLRVKLRRHPRFELRNKDLHAEVKVPLTTSVLGGNVSVPTLDGHKEIKVPAGSPPGRVFRLRGQGMPSTAAGGERGDLLATLKVEIPGEVTGRAKDLFEELRGIGH